MKKTHFVATLAAGLGLFAFTFAVADGPGKGGNKTQGNGNGGDGGQGGLEDGPPDGGPGGPGGPGGGPGGPGGGPGGPGGMNLEAAMRFFPVTAALDTDKNGELSPEEIANVQVLETLVGERLIYLRAVIGAGVKPLLAFTLSALAG